MENEIQISVVICAYNAERFIAEAINSVLNQNFPLDRVEIVVVDDGSTDGTAKILTTDFRDKIKYIHRQNGGHMAAVNTALRHVRGKYVCFLDADDYWDKEKLKDVYALFESDEEIDLVYNFLRSVDAVGNTINFAPLPNMNIDYESDQHLLEHLAGRLPYKSPTSGISVRRACLEKMGEIPEENKFPDYVIHMILPFYANKIRYLRKPLHSYRMHENNTWENKKFSAAQLQWGIELRNNIRKLIVSHAAKQGYNVQKLLSRFDSDVNREKIILLNAQGKKLQAIWKAISAHYRIYDRNNHPVVYAIYARINLLCLAMFSEAAYRAIYEKYSKSKVFRFLHQLWRPELRR